MKRSLALLAAGLLVLAGCAKKADDAPEDAAPKPVVQVTTARVTRANIQSTLDVSGTLAPLPSQEAKVAPPVAGRILKMYVKTGDVVRRGEVIAQLDPGPLLGQVQQAEAQVKTNRATLSQAKINYEVQVASQRSSVEQAQTNLQAQQIALQKLIAGSRPQEVQQAQSALTTAEAGLETAQQNLSRSETLFSQGLLARKDLEAAQADVRTANAQVQSAQAALSMSKQGNRPEDVQAGRVAVRQAQEQLKAAMEQASQNESKAQDVQIAQGQLENSIGALQAAQAQLAALTVRSPLDGVVTGETPNPGEAIDTTGSIATIVNLSSVRLLLNVPAAQIADIQPGQVVTFHAESNPAATHHATVTVINKAVDPNTNTVQVEAVAANTDRTLKDDGFVKAQIQLSSRPNALVVPADAVVTKDGKSTVFTVGSDHIAHAVEIKTGARQGDHVEILDGLKEGDQIVVTGAYELDDGTQVQTGA